MIGEGLMIDATCLRVETDAVDFAT